MEAKKERKSDLNETQKQALKDEFIPTRLTCPPYNSDVIQCPACGKIVARRFPMHNCTDQWEK